MASHWATPANGLTLLRLLLAPALVVAITRGDARSGFALFALAVASDFADGWLARRRGESSALGGALDHAVDATFCTASTAALAHAGMLPVLLPLLIAVAFLQYAFDSRRVSTRGLRASAIGRWNGIAYYVIVGIPVVRDGLGLGWPGGAFVLLLGWALVATTLLSIGDRLRVSWMSARRAPGSPA